MIEFEPHPTETIPEGEMEAIQKVAELQMKIIHAKQDPRKRGQHSKAMALVQATFEVEKDLPPALQIGLLGGARKFDALVRLSTGLNPNDHEPNTHAMAVKVLNADGAAGSGEIKCQDFITLAYPHFFIQTAEQYAELFTESQQDPTTPKFWSKHPEFAHHQPAHFKVISYHLEQQYWGQTPIALGDQAIRFTFAPHISNLSGLPKASTPNGLLDALIDQLTDKRRPAVYDFCIQLQTDAATMPVEDSTVPWASPVFKVATLTIPPQEFNSDAQRLLGENLAWDPWHCLPEHQPLGSVQRCRKLVYEASRSSRHKQNGIKGFTLTPDKLSVMGSVLMSDAA